MIFRGGTSKGVYLLASDLPEDVPRRDALLVALLGSMEPRQVDGLGGGSMLTSKVAIVSRASEEGVDLEYRFVQVLVDTPGTDSGPTCGNIMSGVGAFAVESGLIEAGEGETRVVIRDINTGVLVEEVIQTPGRRVCYEGDCEMSGVPGTAAPVRMNFMEIAGAKTGRLLPTGKPLDTIDGVAVTCIDAAMPMVVMAGADFDVSCRESRDELNGRAELFRAMEKIRVEAGRKMGLGDVRGKVMPKLALVARPAQGGDIASRYFTPTEAHAAYAVSGGCALSACLMIEGSVANRVASPKVPVLPYQREIVIEHPSGVMRVMLEMVEQDGAPLPLKVGIVRTARLLMKGVASVPDAAL